MLRQIEVEGVGTMCELTDWQINRLQRIRGPNRNIAPMALGLGMTYHQYRQLTPEQHKACWEAFCTLTRPPGDQRLKGVR